MRATVFFLSTSLIFLCRNGAFLSSISRYKSLKHLKSADAIYNDEDTQNTDESTERLTDEVKDQMKILIENSTNLNILMRNFSHQNVDVYMFTTEVSAMAVNTVSYYMTEFHDDAAQTFLLNHNDFRNKGFIAEDDWRRSTIISYPSIFYTYIFHNYRYLETLIRMDEFEVQVVMKRNIQGRNVLGKNSGNQSVLSRPIWAYMFLLLTNSALIGTNHTDIAGKNMKMQYMHKLVPRKVANQFLQVLEGIVSCCSI